MDIELQKWLASRGLSAAPGSDFTYALPYSSLQEIHALVGEVCGSHMNLPVRMIRKAHQVHSLMLDLKIIHPICTSANVEKKP
jgi:hypothetical protein